jgi:hypothetical protein
VPRANRRSEVSARPLASVGSQREEEFHGRPYLVRTVPASDRVYRCPGCDQEITRMPHVVTWPADDFDATHRRHWHTACWQARDRRRPAVRRPH